MGYTITIAPDDSSQATTTLRVELEGGEARITDLHVRAAQGAGLTAGQLPAVDLDLLMRAVTPISESVRLRRSMAAISSRPEPRAARGCGWAGIIGGIWCYAVS